MGQIRALRSGAAYGVAVRGDKVLMFVDRDSADLTGNSVKVAELEIREVTRLVEDLRSAQVRAMKEAT